MDLRDQLDLKVKEDLLAHLAIQVQEVTLDLQVTQEEPAYQAHKEI